MKHFFLLLLWAVLSTALFSAANTLKRAEIKNSELHIVFSSWLNSKDVHQMTLSDPPRQVIDIKNARLGNQNIASSLSARGVTSFRVAQYKEDVVRIVIETGDSYKCRGYQPMASRTAYRIPLPKAGGYGSSARPERRSKEETKPIKAAKKTPAKQVKKAPAKRVKKKSAAVRKPPEEQIVTEEKASFFSSLFSKGASGPRRSYTVVVDAGHGGHDSGAVGAKRYYEKTVVLQIAKRVEKHLKKKRFKVKMTRSSDHFVKLKNRTRFANRHKADIFVSIHANAIGDKKRFGKVYGVETYFLQTTRSARSKRIAALENSVVLDKSDFVSKNVILEAVLSGPKIELSHKLAIDIQTRMLRDVRRKYKGVKDGGVRPAPFWVLVGAQMPSVLVEVGYITNPIERRRIFNPDYQNRIAKGIVEGISNYLIIREKELN